MQNQSEITFTKVEAIALSDSRTLEISRMDGGDITEPTFYFSVLHKNGAKTWRSKGFSLNLNQAMALQGCLQAVEKRYRAKAKDPES